jgi:transcriptional regulator with PAS, ATPase and Fis domain
MVDAGTFREDLYYRLNVVRILLPPLRERRGDVPMLCEQFIDKFNKQFGKRVKGVSDEAMGVLMNHGYPGNIRELENALEYAFVFCTGETILPEHLPEEMDASDSPCSEGGVPLTAYPSFDALEADYLRAIIAECGGSKVDAAKRLDVHKTTLFRKLKKYNL